MSELVVHSLYHFPVKSCQPISIDQGRIVDSGFDFDRRWMIVESKTERFVTQRKFPSLARIKVIADDQVLHLELVDVQSSSAISVPVQRDKTINAQVWKDNVVAWDQGDQVAAWLSDFLEVDVRLAFIDDHQLRQVDTDFAEQGDQVGFADGFPFLITTQSSIEQFNRDLGYDVSIARFRPNIVISGDNLGAYAEDDWRRIAINGLVFDLVKPCSRCVMPSINPNTLEKERAVTETLLRTRKIGKETYFGQNAIHRQLGVIKVGDSVEILA